jgi:hypothetical protein
MHPIQVGSNIKREKNAMIKKSATCPVFFLDKFFVGISSRTDEGVGVVDRGRYSSRNSSSV